MMTTTSYAGPYEVPLPPVQAPEGAHLMIRPLRSRGATVAIIGLGPWGLAVLERLLASAHRRKLPVTVHVVEERRPGTGMFSPGDPDYLLLNTPCGQHVMHPMLDPGELPPYAVSLYDWAHHQGYRWVGTECRIGGLGRQISPHDFLPRRLMGEWLNWCYQQMVACLPSGVSVQIHATTALDVEPVGRNRERVILSDGTSFQVDHVILTTGHTPEKVETGVHSAVDPYPITDLQALVEPGQAVAVAGLGLVALDVVTSLTSGRGGRFEDTEGQLVYHPSGLEPTIYLFSRSGRPYSSKAVGASDPTGDYVPVICTPVAASKLRAAAGGGISRGSVDFRRDLLPLVVAEMQVRYYRQKAAIIENRSAAGEELTDMLARAWSEGCFAEAVEGLSRRYGFFDPERDLFSAELNSYGSSQEYEASVCEDLAADLAEATAEGPASPVKVAYETLRLLRDTMRTVIEFEGLTPESFREFHTFLGNRIKAAVTGPPASRTRELLALIDSGVVRMPFGPSPIIEADPDGTFVVSSTRLAARHSQRVRHLVRAYLPEPTVDKTNSPLLRRLAERGRLRPCGYEAVGLPSIDLTVDCHPVGCDGEVQDRIWVYGTLTEGVRYFTHYVPSPKSRVRAFIDAEECAESILCAVGDQWLSNTGS